MRCFVSVDLPDDLLEKIEKIQQNISKKTAKLTEIYNLHFTLKFLGEIDEQKASEVTEKLKEVAKEPFKITLKGIGAFPNTRFPRIIWVGCDSKELEKLAKNIDKKMSEIGFPAEKNYKNHITIARIKNEQVNLHDLLSQLENIEIGSMNVDKIMIKQSILGKRGPVYKVLGAVSF